MKITLSKLLSVLLCLALFCGCAAKNSPAGNTDDSTPPAENQTPIPENNKDLPDDTADSTETDGSPVKDEEPPSVEPEPTPIATLTAEELLAWETFFNTVDNNGLLRFPYENPESDPDQLAPCLYQLFYDIGDPEYEFSEEEIALLSETDFWLELDSFRLTRDFMNEYLYTHLNIPAKNTENLLDAAQLGTYLFLYDAWYIAHGDTLYNRYTIDRGELFEDGTIKLYYHNSFLCTILDNDEESYISADMVITLTLREDGSRYISAHQIVK